VVAVRLLGVPRFIAASSMRGDCARKEARLDIITGEYNTLQQNHHNPE